MSKSLKLIIEALLFASEKPLTVREIQSSLPDAKPSDIRSALKVLKHDYETLDRSFVLKEIADGYQFRSRSEYGPYILKMVQSSPERLSRAAMETLAIVAYKQPILRHEIERLRGVDVGGILRTLLEKGLIKIMGRKDLPGRPLIYGTTKRFLEVFDLRKIDDLPKLKEIKSLGSDELNEHPGHVEERGTDREHEKESFQKENPPERDTGPEDQGRTEAHGESKPTEGAEDRESEEIQESTEGGDSPEIPERPSTPPTHEISPGADGDRNGNERDDSEDVPQPTS